MKSKFQKNTITYIILGFTIVLAVIYFTNVYKKYSIKLEPVKNSLIRYQFIQDQFIVAQSEPAIESPSLAKKEKITTHVENLIIALNELNSALVELKTIQKTAPFYLRGNIDTWEAKITLAYQNLIKEQLFPALYDLGYIHLYYVQAGDMQRLYRSLTFYLMLGEPEELNLTAYLTWLREVIGVNRPLDYSALSRHIDYAFQHALLSENINQPIIKLARDTLNQLSTTELAFIILSEYAAEHDSLPVADEISALFSLPYKHIPMIYTREGYENLVSAQLTPAITQASFGNWVLGEKKSPPEQTLEASAQTVRTNYAKNYLTVWYTIISQIKLTPSNDLSELYDVVTVLNNEEGPMAQFINTVIDNTEPLLHETTLNETLHENLSDDERLQLQLIERLIEGESLESVDLDLFHDLLNQLQVYLNTIITADDTASAAFEQVTIRFGAQGDDTLSQIQLKAQQLPTLLQNWTLSAANNAWVILMQDSYHFANAYWKTNIYEPYHSILQTHYPIQEEATEQLSLDTFNALFSNQGEFANLTTMLDTLIDTSEQQWRMKALDNIRFTLSTETLGQLQLVYFINSMFYPALADELAVHFTLQPLSVSSSTKKFELSMLGNTASIHQEAVPAEVSFTWPNDNSNNISLQFTDTKDKITEKTFDGPWALFKLLGAANLRDTDNPQEFTLTFSIDNQAAHYILVASTPLNPFVFNILNQVDLPKNL